MIRATTQSLPLALAIVAACTTAPPPAVARVDLDAAGWHVDGVVYPTLPAFVAAIKANPRLSAILLLPAAGAVPAQVTDTVTALQAAGVRAPVGFVGNEVFTK